jgi:hypothetical protein
MCECNCENEPKEEINSIKRNIVKDLAITRASCLFNLTTAYTYIQKATRDRYMGSGVTITVKNINQNDDIICEEFMIKDGLSDATIKAIQDDIIYSFKNDIGLNTANALLKKCE